MVLGSIPNGAGTVVLLFCVLLSFHGPRPVKYHANRFRLSARGHR